MSWNIYIENEQVSTGHLGDVEIDAAYLGNFLLGSKLIPIDYSGIVASLNSLTDTLDTVYDGTNPTLAVMETELDTINGEIITA